MGIDKEFFINLGFNFKKNLKSKKILIDKNPNLSNKLDNNVFFYHNPNQTNTSFYLITNALNQNELESFRKYAWNENEVDLIFYISEFEKDKLVLIYAKTSPQLKYDKCIIETFNANENDLDKIEKIKHWQFDSGAFWLNYQKFLKQVSHKGIDKELINTLNTLKSTLNSSLSKIEKNKEVKDEIVQALIDRTLYIKYLEDNHIINSYFYEYYFHNENIDYKYLLSKKKKNDLNELFKIIHRIFNNNLFNQPSINEKYLTDEICDYIFNSLNHNLDSRQLRLFDFQFNVIPIEFISYIYEIFLSDKQKKNGIYYTPKKLAQLIVDDVIPSNSIGTVLDPSCGSGMFLIVAFQKLLENCSENQFNCIEDKIEHRTKLLSDNIFGIEKEITAKRFTLFSLSLQLFRDLNPFEIKEFISNQLKQNKEVALFNKHSFFDNIVCSNTLNQQEEPFRGKIFQYIIGNPPFFEIKQTDEEISFINNYEIELNDKSIKAKNIVGKHQISQCFLIKIKDWSDCNTRFGFVSNSSNFYNDNSNLFQDFFYSAYNIEKIYELSRVKKILFEKAKESVVALVFSNKLIDNNTIEYYTVDLGIFSEKPFELLIIQEDMCVEIIQSKLLSKQINLRNFLFGNKHDRDLLKRLSELKKIEDYLIQLEGTKNSINNGLQIVGKEQLIDEFNISENNWKNIIKHERDILSDKFKSKYTSSYQTTKFPTPLIYPRNLNNFTIEKIDTYLGDISNFQRTRNDIIYSTPKILINRTGKDLKATFIKDKIYYNFDIYSIFLEDFNLYYFFTAIINSKIANYFVDFLFRKRVNGSYPKIGYDAITNIPIPLDFNRQIFYQISEISKNLIENKTEFSKKIENELNELIFELYDLSYTEVQRIKDYYLLKDKTSKTKKELENYKSTIIDILSIYLKNSIDIEFSETDFNLIVAKIFFNKKESEAPSTNKTKKYILNQIFEENPSENFLASQEKIYAKDCVYIIKKDLNTNWSKTKAFEDGQDILKHIIQNGERVY